MANSGRLVRRAIIPVAGRGTRLFPATAAVAKGLLPLVDVDGVARAVLHMIIREAVAGGIDELALVVSPGQQEQFQAYFAAHQEPLAGRWGRQAQADAQELADLAKRIRYVVQPTPEGLGQAIWCARAFAAGEPVLVLLGDHLWLSDARTEARPLKEICEQFAQLNGVSLTAVQRRPIEVLKYHGTLAGEPLEFGGSWVYRIRDIVEKPDGQTARRRLVTPGLPPDQFLTHAGAYIFQADLFDALEELVGQDRRERGEIQLASAQEMLIRDRKDYFAVELKAGSGLDVGNPQGLVEAQQELARRCSWSLAPQ